MKILIIEDEPALSSSISQYLQEDGYLCEVAANFEEAQLKAGSFEYECILVDLTIPGGNGMDIIKELKKKHSSAGIIIISAKYSLENKIEGLEAGSDDYLTKPFHLSELNARIKALMRRKHFKGEQRLEFQEISISLNNHEVLVNSQLIDITRSEYRLLLYFLSNRKRVLSKESIAEHLAGDQAEMMDSFDFIYSHIKNLRKKLVAAGSKDYIRTVYGIGYKFADQ